jgi:hypothetical protein
MSKSTEQQDNRLILSCARMKNGILQSTFTIHTEDGEGMGVVGTAQINHAYQQYTETYDSVIAELREENEQLKGWISSFGAELSIGVSYAVTWDGTDEIDIDFMDIEIEGGTHYWANNSQHPPTHYAHLPLPIKAAKESS